MDSKRYLDAANELWETVELAKQRVHEIGENLLLRTGETMRGGLNYATPVHSVLGEAEFTLTLVRIFLHRKDPATAPGKSPLDEGPIHVNASEVAGLRDCLASAPLSRTYIDRAEEMVAQQLRLVIALHEGKAELREMIAEAVEAKGTSPKPRSKYQAAKDLIATFPQSTPPRKIVAEYRKRNGRAIKDGGLPEVDRRKVTQLRSDLKRQGASRSKRVS
jgi:hypothetical protein